MPELPDIELYLVALRQFVVGQTLDSVQVRSPFVVRSVDLGLDDCVGRAVLGVQRLGKRVVFEFRGGIFLVVHLMIAGRFHWKAKRKMPRAKVDLVAFHFGEQTLMLTESSTKKRASIHVVDGVSGLSAHLPAGLEVLDCTENEFRDRLTVKNHTLKRALTDPWLFSGIGNAYSDEILHAAGLSPLKWTSKLTPEEITRLFRATQRTLREWIERLQVQNGSGFPEKVTAFRPDMAAHGKFRKPCPKCQTPIQRIVYAENETNYCPKCQTGGKLLADRSLSRLLRDDWPRTIDELDN